MRKVAFKRPLTPTISSLQCQRDGLLFEMGFFCSASSCSRAELARSCAYVGFCTVEEGLLWEGLPCCSGVDVAVELSVAQHMRDPNGFIDARSLSTLAPDSVAALGRKRQKPPKLSFFAITLRSSVHNAVQCLCVGPHCVSKRKWGLS